MGMTIDEIIQGIQIIKAQAEWDYPLDWQIVLDGATDIMRKYQMIQEIVNGWNRYRNGVSSSEGDSIYMQKIREVLEDGNND